MYIVNIIVNASANKYKICVFFFYLLKVYVDVITFFIVKGIRIANLFDDCI